MDDKKEMTNVAETIAKNISVDTAESLIKTQSDKISASPLVQGFLIGYVCARFPVGLFVALGTGFLGGLYLEENFKLPDLKTVITSYLPTPKEKP